MSHETTRAEATRLLVQYEYSDEGDHPTYVGTGWKLFASEADVVEWAERMSYPTVPADLASFADRVSSWANSTNDSTFRIVCVLAVVPTVDTEVGRQLSAKVEAAVRAKNERATAAALVNKGEREEKDADFAAREAARRWSTARAFIEQNAKLLSAEGVEKYEAESADLAESARAARSAHEQAAARLGQARAAFNVLNAVPHRDGGADGDEVSAA